MRPDVVEAFRKHPLQPSIDFSVVKEFAAPLPIAQPESTGKPKNRKHARLYAQQNGICAYCDEPFGSRKLSPTLEHILPKSKGGTNKIGNLCLVHQSCNYLRKNFVTHEEATRELRQLLAFFDKLRDKGILSS